MPPWSLLFLYNLPILHQTLLLVELGNIAARGRVVNFELPYRFQDVGVWRQDVYRLAKQHMIPVLPRNQQKPMKRIIDKKAVAYNRTWKNIACRFFAVFCNLVH